MRTVFIFHGTEGSPQGNWFPWLKEELEKLSCNVIVPKFPHPEKPNFKSWLEHLDVYREYINEKTIFVGHSLGGLFLLRVLEKLENPVAAAIFVSASIGVKPIKFYESDYKFSGFSFDWEEMKKKAHYFSVYHSDNDPYVSLGNGEELAKHLEVRLNFIPNAGHLNAESGYTKFDELLEEIKKLIN